MDDQEQPDAGDLIGTPISGPDGYSFGGIEQKSGDVIRIEVVRDEDGEVVTHAEGVTMDDLRREAARLAEEAERSRE